MMKRSRRSLALLLALTLVLCLLPMTALAAAEVPVAVEIAYPAVGDTPDTSPIITQGADVVSGVKEVRWYSWDPEGGVSKTGLYCRMTADQVFRADVKYRLEIELTFKGTAGERKIKPGSTINGMDASTGGSYYILTLTDFFALQRIDAVNLDVTAFCAGDTPEDIYVEAHGKSDPFTVEAVRITDSGDNVLAMDHVFAEKEDVYVYADLRANDTFAFPRDSKDLSACFNGEAGQEAYGGTSNQTATVYMRYRVASPVTVSEIALTGPTPETGSIPFVGASAYALSSDSPLYISRASWFPVSEKGELLRSLPIDAFRPGGTYAVELEVLDDYPAYVLPDDASAITATYNGLPAEVEHEAHWHYAFVTAKFTIPGATVSFDPNGGTGTMDAEDLSPGAEFELPECSFTAPEGKTFVKWDLGRPGETVAVAEDTVLKAIWGSGISAVSVDGVPALLQPGERAADCRDVLKVPEDAPYTVLSAQWGVSTEKGDELIPEGTVFEEGKLYFLVIGLEAKAGYGFSGAFTLTVNGAPLPDELAFVSPDQMSVTVPLLCGAEVTVTFDANGGSGTMAELKVKKGARFVLPENGFAAPDGKEFEKWDLGAPGTEVELAADTVLKALWKLTEEPLPFTDVPETAWYYNDVKTAYSTGLVNGRTATSFAPKDNMTYAEAIKLAACMHQLYTAGAVTLTNGTGKWYDSYVQYAKDNGIIAKDYEWTAEATRAGYVEIFANALPAAAFEARNSIVDGAIPDVPMTHPQAAAVYKLYRAGILNGSDSMGTFNPDNRITRAEVSAILTRMMDPAARKSLTL